MARKPDSLPENFDAEESGGWLADEEDLDRRALWRLGWWGAGSVAAVIGALMVSQSAIGLRRDQIAAADLTRHSQQIASVAKDSQTEARRLASAIDTLNGDRDRLYSRVTVLEQGFDSITGSIARQNSAAAVPQAASPSAGTSEPQPAPVAATPATTLAPLSDRPREAAGRPTQSPSNMSGATAATPLMAAKSMMAPPDPAAARLVPPQPPPVITAEPDTGTPPAPETVATTSSETPAWRTEFGVDLGGAASVDGLRALWRGVLASHEAVLSPLRPVIALKERGNGAAMQLRLVAGPLNDAAAAARICAVLVESRRACETSVFDGQRLAMKSEDPPPIAARPALRKRTVARRPAPDETPLRPPPGAVSAVSPAR